jgi:hypothetical protein
MCGALNVLFPKKWGVDSHFELPKSDEKRPTLKAPLYFVKGIDLQVLKTVRLVVPKAIGRHARCNLLCSPAKTEITVIFFAFQRPRFGKTSLFHAMQCTFHFCILNSLGIEKFVCGGQQNEFDALKKFDHYFSPLSFEEIDTSNFMNS